MFARTLLEQVLTVSASFPVVLVTGPRQVGKTTLLEMCKDRLLAAGDGRARTYVTLDDLDARNLAQSDPALFLQAYPPPLIIDEVQYAPQLFSAIKIHADRNKLPGQFWLTGSQKFHLMSGVTESLAGRIAILDLIGLSQQELDQRVSDAGAFVPTSTWISAARQTLGALSPHSKMPVPKKLLSDIYQQIWLGGYPMLVQQGPSIRDVFFRSYVQTYIQRDVRDILKVSDPVAFSRFLGIAAARTGQLLNYSSFAKDVDIDVKTAKAWLSVLQMSGLVYLLQPFHRNVTKRMVKAPKLYFLDTGLASYLTRWPDAASLEAGAMSGAILETWFVSEILKSYWHRGMDAPLYYYRDDDQNEVDLLIEAPDQIYPVEFRKTATPSLHATKSFGVLKRLGLPIGPGGVVCLVERDTPLSAEVCAIPAGYL